MSRLSGSIRLVSEKPPIIAPSEKAIDNLFAFNKGISITANNGYEVILRPEVHGFDIKLTNIGAVNINNFAVRAKDLKLPKTGNYFVTFDVRSATDTDVNIATDINDEQTSTSPVAIPTTKTNKYFGLHKNINPDAFKDHGINGGFIDFNIISGNLATMTTIHVENVMIGAGSKEAPFSRPIEDIVANALNGIDSPPVVPRRFLATIGVFYKNGKEVDANDGVAYLDFIVPSKTDNYREANMYMCLEPTKFNVEPTKDIIEQSGKFKLVHRKAIEQIDTLISNTIDTNNLSAQRVIFKSGNTVKGVVTGTPGSSVTSNASGDKVEGTAKYYMWLGSDVPESAPFSIDVDGNVKIGGKASFQRTSVDVTSNITINTSTKDSLFNIIDTKQNSIIVTIEDGDYTNKEFEFISMSNRSDIENGGFQIAIKEGADIEFVHGGYTSKLIYVNQIGSSVKLRHIKTNLYGTVKNYLVVVNASDFTYDQHMIVSKPIRYAGTKYDISISIKDKDFYFSDSRNKAIEDPVDNIFGNTNINDDIKRLAPSNVILTSGVPITITVKEYNTNNVLIKTVSKTISSNNGASDWPAQVYFLGQTSGSNLSKVLINFHLNNLAHNLEEIINPMTFNNSITLVYDKFANGVVDGAWAFPLCIGGGTPSQTNYDYHSLIISPIPSMSKRDKDGTNETDIVVFNGTLYIRY
jgi:hypothetical protein|nr:MAG TPA: hypothetical protein [Crassvirales sp.]